MPYDVFLSYCAADRRMVERLAQRLQAEGLQPFLDEWHLLPGRLWQPELEKALAQSRSVAVFVGAEGLGPWERQEMLLALDRGARDPGFPVIPVLLPGSRKPDALPGFLAQRVWVELPSLDDPDALHRLIRGIREQAPGSGTPSATFYRSMAPAREAFVHRNEYEEAVTALCAAAATDRGTRVGLTTALHGAGGFGKTALAQEICHDPRIHAHFPDGILWVTMGDNLDGSGRLARVRDLIRWWTRRDAPPFEVASTAGRHLQELLAGKRVLLVVDDVWNATDVAPFLGLGPETALLITSRDSRTLPEDAISVRVDAMAAQEAVRLLGTSLPSGSARELSALAASLGEWPLLLKIVNRQLRDRIRKGQSPVEALHRIKEILQAKGLSFFDRHDLRERSHAVALTLDLSLGQLPPEARDRYFQLAVFPEDLDIPFSILERLWSLDGFEVEDFCTYLSELSLLLQCNLKTGTIRLHDVIRTYLIETQGEALPTCHQRLLAACRPKSGIWPDLPKTEAYLWRHLVHHMDGAGERSTFQRLLLDFKYLQAKLDATDIHALLEDYRPFVEGDDEIRLAREALWLSAPCLIQFPDQLRGQLMGRLQDRKNPGIVRLLEGAQSAPGPWLRPRTANLLKPGATVVRTLEGEYDWNIYALIAVDSRQVVFGSAQNLYLWDVDSDRTRRLAQGHSDLVLSLASVDNRSVASGSRDRTVRVWDLETGETKRVLQGHTRPVFALASLGGDRIASGSNDRTIIVWDLETGRRLTTLRGHTGGIKALSGLSGDRIASADTDGAICIWDLQTGRCLRRLGEGSSAIAALTLVGDHHLVSCDDDGLLQVWNLENGNPGPQLRLHAGELQLFRLAALDDHRVACSGAGAIHLWNIHTGQVLSTLLRQDHFTALARLGSGRLLSGSPWLLRIWDTERNEEEQAATSDAHRDRVTTLAFVDSRRVVSGSNDHSVRSWNATEGKALNTFQVEGILTLNVLQDGGIVCGTDQGSVLALNVETGQMDQLLEIYHESLYYRSRDSSSYLGQRSSLHARYCRLSTQGTEIFFAHGLVVQVLDPSFREHLRLSFTGVVPIHIEPLDEHRLACLLIDQFSTWTGRGVADLHLVNLESTPSLTLWLRHVSTFRVLNSGLILAGLGDGTLKLLDSSGQIVRTLLAHQGRVNALAAFGDRFAVSASSDRTLRVWDLECGRVLALFACEAEVRAVAVSPDASTIVVGDELGRVHFFDLVGPFHPSSDDGGAEIR